MPTGQASHSSSALPEKIPQLTFLRFVAALGVLVFHYGRSAPSLAWGEQVWAVANNAVSFFFFLSGFVLTYVYARRGIPHRVAFYVARIARIAPAYILALAPVIFYEWMKGRFSPVDAWLSLGLLQSWVPGKSQVLNQPGWSLSVEYFFYLIFPALLALLVRIQRSSTLIVMAAMTSLVGTLLHVLLSSQVPHSGESALGDFAAYHPVVHLPTFAFGCMGSLLYMRHRQQIIPFGGLFMLGALVIWLSVVLIPNPMLKYHHNGLFAPIYLLGVMGLAAGEQTWVARQFSLSPFVVLGELSYSLYILQDPFNIAYSYAKDRIPFVLGPDSEFYLRVVLLVAVSYLVWRWFECPMRRWIQSAYRARIVARTQNL